MPYYLYDLSNEKLATHKEFKSVKEANDARETYYAINEGKRHKRIGIIKKTKGGKLEFVLARAAR